MKRLLLLLLILATILPGCGRRGTPLLEPVYFYYPRLEYTYGEEDSVISWEALEGFGYTDDLDYLLSLYLIGPADESLTAIFPIGTELISTVLDGDTLTIQISDTAQELSDARYSLACSCLSMTCLELTQAQTVTVCSGHRSSTAVRDAFLLVDDYMPAKKR